MAHPESEQVSEFEYVGPNEEWVMSRIIWDMSDGMTFDQAVARERTRYDETVEELKAEGASFSQTWHDVVKVMRQTAREIADNAKGWWAALDDEENRLHMEKLDA